MGPRQEDSRYPTAVKGVALRYSDLPEKVMLRVPTQDSFVAMKCAAYEDRKLPKTCSISGRSPRGRSDHPAVRDPSRFPRVRSDKVNSRGLQVSIARRNGDTGLAHQTKNVGDPLETLSRVRAALSLACGWGAGPVSRPLPRSGCGDSLHERARFGVMQSGYHHVRRWSSPELPGWADDSSAIRESSRMPNSVKPTSLLVSLVVAGESPDRRSVLPSSN